MKTTRNTALMNIVTAAICGVLTLSAPTAFAQPAKTEPSQTEPAKSEPTKTDPAKPADKQPEKPADKPAPKADAPASTPAQEKLVYIHMKTSMGDIFLELDNVKAPISTANFIKYTESGFYDGTIFHRVINDFMVQGGGFSTDLKQKTTTPTIKNEWQNGLKNDVGTVAMARLGGAPDSASNQFFINVKKNEFLDQPQADGAAYAVFGKVISGMDVVNKIKAIKTENKGGAFVSLPSTMVVIEKVKVVTKADVDASVKK